MLQVAFPKKVRLGWADLASHALLLGLVYSWSASWSRLNVLTRRTCRVTALLHNKWFIITLVVWALRKCVNDLRLPEVDCR